MKLTKERVQTEKEKKQGILQRMKKPLNEEKKKVYNPKLEIWISEPEFERITQAIPIKFPSKRSAFLNSSIENFKTLDQLTFPDTGNAEVKHWLTLNNVEESLRIELNEQAKKLNLSERDFVRAVLWTTAAEHIQEHKEREEKKKQIQENHKSETVTVKLPPAVLAKYKKAYGPFNEEKASEVILQLLNDNLK